MTPLRVEEIQVDGYGHLHGVRVGLDNGFACILGDNEAGKSTLLSFIRSILFGFTQALSEEQRARIDGRIAAPFDPVDGGNKGGSLVLVVHEDGGERRYRFRRTYVRKKDGDLVITDLERNRELQGEEAERLRQRLLPGVDATVFDTVFAIGLDELHGVKALDKENVQGMLFAADAGIGSGIVREMEELGKAADSLYRPRAPTRRINTLDRELKDLEVQVRKAKDEVAEHRHVQDEYRRLEEQIQEVEERRRTLHADSERAAKRQEARQSLARLEQSRAELASYEQRTLPSPDDIEEHAALQSTLKAQTQAADGLKERLTTLHARRQAITFDERDADAAGRLPHVEPQELERLIADATSHRALAEEIDTLDGPYLDSAARRELERLRDRITQHEEALLESDLKIQQAEARIDEARQNQIPDEIQHELTALVAQDVEGCERTLARRSEEAERAARRTEEALATLGTRWDRERLAAAPVDQTTIQQVQGHLVRRTTTSKGAVPWPLVAVGLTLMAVGAVGLAGILIPPLAGGILLIAGLAVAVATFAARPSLPQGTSPSAEAERVLAPYGLPPSTTAEAFATFVSTLHQAHGLFRDERRAQEERAEAQRQHQQNVERLRALAQGLDLPATGAPATLQRHLADRLKAANLAASQQQEAERTRAELRAEQDRHERALGEAQKARGACLNAVDVAPDLTDDALRPLLNASEQRDRLLQRIETLTPHAERFATIEARFAAVQEARQDQMPELPDFGAVFHRVTTECRNAAAARQEAAHVDQQIQETLTQLDLTEDKRRSTEATVGAFYARFAVDGAAGLSALRTEVETREKVRTKHEIEQEKIGDMRAAYPDLDADLQRTDADDDARLLAAAEDERTEMTEHLKALHAAKEQRYAVLSKVHDEDTLTALLQRRDALRAERDDALQEWLRVALAKKLLDKVRETYERDHGPKVLQAAGALLLRMTDGRYESIHRDPEGTYVLTRTDGRQVQAVPPNVSRATFAQVYLAIRLAYVDVHEGHQVPYLLDDVLSDFDDGRLERTLELLLDLSRRRQVVLFTHHGHIAKRLEALDVPVTRLDSATAVRPIVK